MCAIRDSVLTGRISYCAVLICKVRAGNSCALGEEILAVSHPFTVTHSIVPELSDELMFPGTNAL